MRIGYVGLGAMGGALARRLLKSQPLVVWDLQPDAVGRMAKLGATPAATPADLARGCDLIFTCLPRSANVQELLFGTGGLAAALTAGTIVVDQTSGNPHDTARMARELTSRGGILLDAPVSGGQSGAEAGTIAIMVAGPQDSYAQVLPVLRSVSPNVEYCGPRVGDAHALKVVNNTMSGSTRLATVELAALGCKLGLPLSEIASAMDQGDGRNRTTGFSFPSLGKGQPPVNAFALALLLKDLDLGTSLGMGSGVPLPIANLVRSHHAMALGVLGPDAQLQELFGLVARMAGTDLLHVPASPPAAPDHAVPGLLATGVAVSNLLMTYECAALGVKYGLSLELMAKVILKGGAWTGAAERVLPVLSADQPASGRKLTQALADLRLVADLAKRSGTPLLVCDLARGLLEAALNRFGDQADLDVLAKLYEELAGTRFLGA
ncbi:NAD(P)-binding domain-containing protein [Xylophilus sp. GW821-FHT01B05]